MSHPVNTMSFRFASGTKSLINGDLLSVRLPNRIVPICVSEPIGLARPRRTASTPAIIVVATAPRPTTITPSLPLAGAGCSICAVFEPLCSVLLIPFQPSFDCIAIHAESEFVETQQCTPPASDFAAHSDTALQ